MKILIISTEHDDSAKAVSWGLKQLGHTSTLWKEQIDPRLPMLDTFCRFLIGSGNCANGAAPKLSLGDYYASTDFKQWQGRKPADGVTDESIFTIEHLCPQ